MIRFKVGPTTAGSLWCVLCGRKFGDPDFEVVIFVDRGISGPVCFDCLKVDPKEYGFPMPSVEAVKRARRQMEKSGKPEEIKRF